MSWEDELTAPTVRKRIRPAVEDDLAALVAEGFGPEGLYRDRLEMQQEGNGQLLIYRLDPEGSPHEPPDGVVFLWLREAEEQKVRKRLPGVPLIMHLKVHHDRRGYGIGTELMNEAERIAAEAGKTRIALGVDASNANAIALYRRLGYREWPHGPVVTHRSEYRERRKRRYLELCLIFVKPVSTASPRGELQSLAAAPGTLA
jgi:ribosomal protein S18 acetylase RimI-like enzyme